MREYNGLLLVVHPTRPKYQFIDSYLSYLVDRKRERERERERETDRQTDRQTETDTESKT